MVNFMYILPLITFTALTKKIFWDKYEFVCSLSRVSCPWEKKFDNKLTD